jgi:hypothetical protein
MAWFRYNAHKTNSTGIRTICKYVIFFKGKLSINFLPRGVLNNNSMVKIAGNIPSSILGGIDVIFALYILLILTKAWRVNQNIRPIVILLVIERVDWEPALLIVQMNNINVARVVSTNKMVI